MVQLQHVTLGQLCEPLRGQVFLHTFRSGEMCLHRRGGKLDRAPPKKYNRKLTELRLDRAGCRFVYQLQDVKPQLLKL